MAECFLDLKTSSPAYVAGTTVATGHHSTLYKAQCLQTGRIVALKVFKAAQCAKAEVLALRRLLAGQSGEENLPGARHCARLLGLARAQRGPRFAIALEWAEGCDIATLCLSEARPYLKMLLETLRFAHSQGVLHRDLKPEHTIIDKKTTRLRVVDWSMATVDATGHVARTKLLRAAPGTPYYKPPESLLPLPPPPASPASDGDLPLRKTTRLYPVGPSADVWAFGCILAGRVVGRRHFFLPEATARGRAASGAAAPPAVPGSTPPPVDRNAQPQLRSIAHGLRELRAIRNGNRDPRIAGASGHGASSHGPTRGDGSAKGDPRASVSKAYYASARRRDDALRRSPEPPPAGEPLPVGITDAARLAADLALRALRIDPAHRLSPEEALAHRFFGASSEPSAGRG
jgi:serine/threonine protein kinase